MLCVLPLGSLQLGSSGVASKLSAWQGWELLCGSSLSCPEQTVEQTVYCPMPVFLFSSRFLFRFVPFEFTVQMKKLAVAFVSEGRCLLWQKPRGTVPCKPYSWCPSRPRGEPSLLLFPECSWDCEPTYLVISDMIPTASRC